MFNKVYLISAIVLLSNFVNSQSVFVEGTVFVDKNDNGFQDFGEFSAAELGMSLTIELVDEDLNLIATTTTDANGNYFIETVPGRYIVRFMPPARLSISSSVNNTNDDDIDGDDNGIQLDTNSDGLTDGLINSTIISLDIDQEPTNEPNSGCFPTADDDTNSTIDFGLTALLSLGGTVYSDENDNGIFDPGENSMGDVGRQITMDLFDSNDSLIQTTQTNPNGAYTFNAKTGDYYIRFTPPARFPTSSTITSTTDDNISLDDNGIQLDTDGDGSTDGMITSPVINLQTGDEPLNEPISQWDDENDNFTIDFGLIENTSSVAALPDATVSIVPNPVSDYLYISTETGFSSLEIRSTQGQMIKKTLGFSLKRTATMDVSDLVSGHYVVIIKFSDGIIQKQMVKL